MKKRILFVYFLLFFSVSAFTQEEKKDSSRLKSSWSFIGGTNIIFPISQEYRAKFGIPESYFYDFLIHPSSSVSPWFRLEYTKQITAIPDNGSFNLDIGLEYRMNLYKYTETGYRKVEFPFCCPYSTVYYEGKENIFGINTGISSHLFFKKIQWNNQIGLLTDFLISNNARFYNFYNYNIIKMFLYYQTSIFFPLFSNTIYIGPAFELNLLDINSVYAVFDKQYGKKYNRINLYSNLRTGLKIRYGKN